MVLVDVRVDQNKVTESPGSTARLSDVKNSTRGAFGFTPLVGVISNGLGVWVAPNSGVGEGPPVGLTGRGEGETVTVASTFRVADGVSVSVGVIVGRSVGTICTAVAPQPLKKISMMIIANSVCFWDWVWVKVNQRKKLNKGYSYRP